MDLYEIFVRKGYLLSPEVVNKYRRETLFEILEKLPKKEGIEVLTEEKVEKYLNVNKKIDGKVEVIFSYNPEEYKLLPKTGWHALFYSKYMKLKKILLDKMKYSSNIENVIKKTSGEFNIIGMIYEIAETPSGKIILKLDDPTGFINVILPEDLKNIRERLTLDEVIGIKGVKIKKDTLVAKEIYFPSYVNKHKPQINEDVYALIIGDIHTGSNKFLSRVARKLVKWLEMKDYYTNRQKEIIERIKYVIFAGDIVDGIGIYPEQKKELEITDLYEQYRYFVDLFKVDRDLNFIVIPGNHDGLRIAEPQPPFDKDIEKILKELPNVSILSNPTYIRLHNVDDNKGINFLIYHGYSADYYISNVPALMQGYEYPRLYMEWFLEKRHLSPTHGAIPLAPITEDLLVIDKDFDVMIMAHTHRKDIYYSNKTKTLLISTACLQALTPFQQKIGHKPTPGYIILLNLRTLQSIVIDLIPPVSKSTK